MNKRTVKSWINQIEKKRAEIAKMRDRLSTLKDELECLEDSCCRANDYLMDAIDALSEYE